MRAPLTRARAASVVGVALAGIPQMTGTVEEVTLRITRIRSLDGEVITTPIGQITQVTNPVA